MKYKLLKEFCDINMGQSPDSKTYNEQGYGLPFYQGNADFGKIHPKTRIWCSEPVKKAEAGDILISVRAPIGAMNIANEKCCIGRGVAALTPKEECDKKYLYYALESKVKELMLQGTGSTFKAINKKILEQTHIPKYDIDKQRYVAHILGKVDLLIDKKQQQIEKISELVKSRFIELFGDMYLNPLEWTEVSLESISDIVSGITKGRKIKTAELREVPYMAVSNVKNGYIDWTTVKTIEVTEQELNQYRLLPDDVLMTEGGDSDKVGRGAIIREPLENCIHQNHIFRVRLNERDILPVFFAEYLQHQRAKRYFLGCAKQTTGIASINMKQLRNLPVLMPPLELQQQFATFVTQTDKSKLAVQKSLDELETLKKSLMQEYFG